MKRQRTALCAALLSVLSQAQIANDTCATPIVVQPGVNPAPPFGISGVTFDNTFAVTEGTSLSSCVSVVQDAWFLYTATQGGVVTMTTCDPPGFAAGANSDTVLNVYVASVCTGGGSTTPVACNDDINVAGGCVFKSRVSFLQTTGAAYLVRVGSFGASFGGAFYLTINVVPEAANNEITGAIELADGVNPQPPAGFDGILFSTAGSTPSSTFDPTAVRTDVFFKWTPTAAALTSIRLCPPNFQNQGTLYDGQLTVFAASTPNSPALPVAHINSCLALDEILFDAVGGVTYFVRVSTPAAFNAGTFYLTVHRGFGMTISGPLGPGSLKVEVGAGTPNAPYFSIFTLNGAGFPFGPVFGISPSLIEIQLQLNSGSAPFLGLLNAQGDAVFGPLTDLPAGLTVYGVTLTLTPIGQVAAVSQPASFVVQ